MSDIRLVRKLMFTQDVNRTDDKWQFRMLQAVEVAKRLGFRHFEIDVSGESAEESPEDVVRPRGMFVSIEEMFGRVVQNEPGEEWKTATSEKGKKEKPVRLVRVWAVMAADAAALEVAS